MSVCISVVVPSPDCLYVLFSSLMLRVFIGTFDGTGTHVTAGAVDKTTLVKSIHSSSHERSDGKIEVMACVTQDSHTCSCYTREETKADDLLASLQYACANATLRYRTVCWESPRAPWGCAL